jgi:hypothetical protein
MSVSDLVGEIEGLRARTRRASSGGAVPLAVLGVLVAGSAPLYAAMFDETVRTSTTGDGIVRLFPLGPSGRPTEPMWLLRLLRVHPGGLAYHRLSVYWLLGVPVAFGLVAAYYAWRARRTGLSLDGWRVALVGAVVLAGLLAVVDLGRPRFPGFGPNELNLWNFANPLLVVAAGTFALAWVERSRALLVVAVVFLLGLVAFDARVLSQVGSTEGPYDNIQSVGTGALALGGWLLGSAGLLGLAQRRRG